MTVADAITKARNQDSFTQQELESLLALSPTSPESYQLMATADEISRKLHVITSYSIHYTKLYDLLI